MQIDPYAHLLHALNFAEFHVPQCDVCQGAITCDVNNHDNPVFEQIPEEGDTEMLVLAIDPETRKLMIARVHIESDEAISQLGFEEFHPYYDRIKARWDSLIREYYEPRITVFFQAKYEPEEEAERPLLVVH